jgi:hypothetical protein
MLKQAIFDWPEVKFPIGVKHALVSTHFPPPAF